MTTRAPYTAVLASASFPTAASASCRATPPTTSIGPDTRDDTRPIAVSLAQGKRAEAARLPRLAPHPPWGAAGLSLPPSGYRYHAIRTSSCKTSVPDISSHYLPPSPVFWVTESKIRTTILATTDFSETTRVSLSITQLITRKGTIGFIMVKYRGVASRMSAFVGLLALTCGLWLVIGSIQV